MKVLFINTYDLGYGAEQFAHDLKRQLEGNAVKVSMVVGKVVDNGRGAIELPPGNKDRIFGTLDKIRWKLGYQVPLKRVLSIQGSYNNTWKKLKAIPEYREADVVHLHNIHSEWGFFDMEAVGKICNEKPVVWTLHDMWAFTGGEAYVFNDEGYASGNARSPYGDYYPNTSSFMDRRQELMKAKRELFRRWAGRISFVPNSPWLESCCRKSYVLKDIPVKMIRNGIDLSVFRNTSRRAWKKPRVLIFPSANPYKNTALLHRVLPKLKTPFELITVGERFHLANAKVTQFDFLESRKVLASVFNMADLLVFPSLSESFGLIPCEAKACGVCVIGSGIGGINSQLEGGKGVIFNPDDENELHEKLEHCLTHLDEARAIGRAGEDDAARNYDIRHTAESYMELYRSVIS